MAKKQIFYNSNKDKLEFLQYDDWQEIRLNDEVMYANHTIEPLDWIDFIYRLTLITVNYELIESEN